MITKEALKKGFENGSIFIDEDYAGCLGICCRIGDNAFYFCEDKANDLTRDTYWKNYSLEMTVDMLYEILKDKDSAEENGLDEMELAYYDAVLSDSVERKKTLNCDTTKPLLFIYQIRDCAENEPYEFMGYSWLEKHGTTVDFSRYECVYFMEYDGKMSLDAIYLHFNVHRPVDFYGHSVSTSDIIVLTAENGFKAYFVDDIGFKEVPIPEKLIPTMMVAGKTNGKCGSKDSDGCHGKEKDGWVLTDEDSCQYIRKDPNFSNIGFGNAYELCQIQRVTEDPMKDHDEARIYKIARAIIFASEIDTESILTSYGYDSLEEVQKAYGDSWESILAECQFEMDASCLENISDHFPLMTWKEAKLAIETIIAD